MKQTETLQGVAASDCFSTSNDLTVSGKPKSPKKLEKGSVIINDTFDINGIPDNLHQIETLPPQIITVTPTGVTRTRKRNLDVLGLTPLQKRIYECLESNGFLLRAIDIGKLLGITRHSVSARLGELRIKGLVKWHKGGWYKVLPLENPVTIIDGVNVTLGDWRVQNIHLVARTCVDVSEGVELVFGGLNINCFFGVQNGKVTVVFGADDGLTLEAWVLALDKVESVCADNGYADLQWKVGMCEVLCDHMGYRLDGVSGVSLTDFETGFIEKIYEKSDGVLRHERRIIGSIPVDSVTAYLMGGLSTFRAVSRLEAVESELEALKISSKWGNREIVEIKAMVKELVN